ncbi:MAG TPA: hypothetical protein VJL58_10150 [Pyrinomonadaceae bacterium]|nr:hypothetical protein [Pyrinomonadaceae bacterium]
MPTMFLQADPGIWHYLWPAAFAFVSAGLLAIGGRFLYRRKYGAETRKAEVDTVLAIAKEFPDLLKRVQQAATQAMADERTIYEQTNTIRELRAELKNCMDGHANCKELKTGMLSIMNDTESVIEQIDRPDLLTELRTLKTKLE